MWIQKLFLIDEGRENQNTTKSSPSTIVIEMAFRWRADDGPTLNAGLVFHGIWTSNAKKPYIFVIFQGGHRPPVPPLDPGMSKPDSSKYLLKSKFPHKAPPIICSRRQFMILLFFSKITNKVLYFMRIVCWQKIHMKYHTLFY